MKSARVIGLSIFRVNEGETENTPRIRQEIMKIRSDFANYDKHFFVGTKNGRPTGYALIHRADEYCHLCAKAKGATK